MKIRAFVASIIAFLFLCSAAFASPQFHVLVKTKTSADRAQLASMGVAIDAVDMEKGRSYAIVDLDQIRRIQNAGLSITYLSSSRPKSMDGYHLEAEVDQALTDLTVDYPSLTKLFSIGTTIDGKEIQCLKISDNPDVDESEPAFFLVARHHAREPLSTEVALEFAKRLLENYTQADRIAYLVDNREIFIVPRLNGDGATYDEDQGYAYWRKNRRQNAGQTSECWGVDLNRNYGVNWGDDAGSSDNPCDQVYRGTEAFSEPESAAVRDFLEARTNVTTLISLHSFGEMILYPWSGTDQPIADPTDLAVFERSAQILAFFTGYDAFPGNELYPVSGDTIDWAYGDLDILAFTYELSPVDSPPGFYPQDSIFPEVFDDTMPSFYFAAAVAEDPEMVLSCGLWSLTAQASGSQATIEWAPIVETESAGYDVLRSESEAGPYVAVNASPIAAGQLEYSYADTPGGTKALVEFFYKVKFNSNVGLDQEFGPVSVMLDVTTDDDDDDVADDDDDDATDDDDSTDDDDVTDDDDNDDDSGAASGDDDDDDSECGGCG